MGELDPRLHAYRPDLADIRLQGRVNADRFVEGQKKRVFTPVADLRKAARFDAPIMTQVIYGEDVLVFEAAEGTAFIQSLKDGYVGYINDAVLGLAENTLTHRVIAPRTFIYPGPDLKLSPVMPLSLGSQLTITGEAETRGTRYALLANGAALIANHLAPVEAKSDDYVSIAESLLHTPYLWGGISGFGIDCSGLVQLAMQIAGKSVLRDSDMQQQTIGTELPAKTPLQRGDLVFWKGHVAIAVESDTIIHANGASMDVRLEPLDEAIRRIEIHYGRPTSYRRP